MFSRCAKYVCATIPFQEVGFLRKKRTALPHPDVNKFIAESSPTKSGVEIVRVQEGQAPQSPYDVHMKRVEEVVEEVKQQGKGVEVKQHAGVEVEDIGADNGEADTVQRRDATDNKARSPSPKSSDEVSIEGFRVQM